MRNVFIGLKRNLTMTLQERRNKYEEIFVCCSQPLSKVERFLSNMGFLYSGGSIGGDKRIHISRDETGSSLNITLENERCTIEGRVTEAAAQQFKKYKIPVDVQH